MIIRRQLLRQTRGILQSTSVATSRQWSSSPVSATSLESGIPENSEPLLETQPGRFDELTTLNEEVNAGRMSRKYAQHVAFDRRVEKIGALGAKVNPTYQPYQLLHNPPSVSDVTLELLLASQAHLGHATSLWNPANGRYIFGIRDGIHIIALEQTAAYLRRAAKVVQGVAERAGIILFVGTRKYQSRAVVKAATMAGGCHLFSKWIPGSLTNGRLILGKARLKVVDQLDREIEGFEEQLYDRATLKPDLVICLNPMENYVLLHECALNNIPTIGVIDTNANPTWVTYPIPANDDSLRCIQVIAGVLGRAGEEGRRRRLERAKDGEIAYTVEHNLVHPRDVETNVEKGEFVLNLDEDADLKVKEGEIRFKPKDVNY